MVIELIDTQLTLDTLTRTARVGDSVHFLSPREWAFLEYFVKRPGWHNPQAVADEMDWDASNTTRMYASRLNRRFGVTVIKNRHGWGYSVG